MQIILTGATGLVGSAALYHILSLSSSTAAAKHLSRLSILSRTPDIPLLTHPKKPVENTYTKIDVISHSDFNQYPETLLSNLKLTSGDTAADSDDTVAIIWALGMSQNDAKSAEQYIEVTKTYALNAARAFSTAFKPRQVNFVYVSGEGATSSPGRMTPIFGRVKGETEQELIALARKPEYQNLHIYNVRPGGVDPGATKDGQPAVNDIWNERLRKAGWSIQTVAKTVLMPALRTGLVYKNMHSPTGEVGRVLVELGIGDGKPLNGTGIEDEGRTVRNLGLRRLAKEMDY